VTREEIEQEARRINRELGLHEAPGDVEVIADGLRSLLSRAYEEAALACDKIPDEVVERTNLRGFDEHLSGRQASVAIRALASSLKGRTQGVPELNQSQAECVLTHSHDCYCRLQMPEGCERVTEGESQGGDLEYCNEHGWEPCEDLGVPVGGFNALARARTTEE
jgi:hypothetical protein